MARREHGFTLIEVLVVVTIIGMLMGMIALLAPVVLGKKKETIAQIQISEIAVALQGLKKRSALGWYPPTGMELLRNVNGEMIGKNIGAGNEFNRGIETAVVALHLTGINVTLDLPNDVWGNTDADDMPDGHTQLAEAKRFEFVDPWGNPLAFFSSADYKKPDAFIKIQMNQDEGGVIVEARPWKRKTGLFVNPNSFQLFSAGPDGLFNTGDDIGNWAQSPDEGE